MNKQQESRHNMYNSVLSVLRAHATETAGATALLAAQSELEVNVKAMEARVEKQVVDITGYAQAKARAEKRMVDLALVVSKGTLAYAEVTGDDVLAARMAIGRKRLLDHADGVVARHCTSLLNDVRAVTGDLSSYGVDTARLAQLEAAIAAYDATLVAPRMAIAARKGATAELALLMKDTAKLVSKRLDGLMERYREEAPSFHRAYMDARIVVGPGTRKAKPAADEAAAA